jgi:hypothetical protein
VRYQLDHNPDSAAFILGNPRHEFEIYLDPTTLAEIIRLGTQALRELNMTEVQEQ